MIRLAIFALTAPMLLAPALIGTSVAAPAPASAITASEAVEEIEFVSDVLKRLHPGVDRYITSRNFANLVEGIKARIGTDDVGIDRWYLELSKITAAVCDEHTFVHYPVGDIDVIDENGREPGFYEPLLFVDGVPYLSTLTASEAAGLRVVDIDGVSGERIFEELVERMSADGCAKTRRVLYSGHQGLELLAARLGARPEYTIRARAGTGKDRDFVVAAQQIAPILAQLRSHNLDTTALLIKRGFKTVTDGGGILYAVDEAHSIGYVRLRSFNLDDEAALRRMMRRMIDDNLQDLIVDLQGNPGGLNTTTSLFLSFLLQRAHGFTDNYHVRALSLPHLQHFVWGEKGPDEYKTDMRNFRRAGKRGRFYTLRAGERGFGNPDYDGRITVLIDPATGSAAGAAATILKTYRNVRIVGTRAHSSGSYFCFRPRGFYVLPHSNFLVSVPHMCASRTGKIADRFANAVEPDLFVPMTTEAIKDLPEHTIATAIDDILARRGGN